MVREQCGAGPTLLSSNQLRPYPPLSLLCEASAHKYAREPVSGGVAGTCEQHWFLDRCRHILKLPTAVPCRPFCAMPRLVVQASVAHWTRLREDVARRLVELSAVDVSDAAAAVVQLVVAQCCCCGKPLLDSDARLTIDHRSRQNNSRLKIAWNSSRNVVRSR